MANVELSPKLDFDDVLIRPKRSTLSTRSAVDIHRTVVFPHNRHTWSGFPLVASNMDTVGTFAMARALAEQKMLTCIHKYYRPEEWDRFDDVEPDHFAVTIGSAEQELDALRAMAERRPVKWLCLDVANGYSEQFLNAVRRARAAFPEGIVVAGNVATREMTEALIIAGADVVKVGIGSGSACITRKVAGVGYPQLSAILECADAAHGMGGHVMSDGGCRTPGDVAKAFGAGADFVMLGGMLAGHDESGGEVVVNEDGQERKEFYGMSSHTAMEKYAQAAGDYRASEGKRVELPLRGPVAATLQEIMGGVRSACTYVGARRLKDLPKCTTFVRVFRQANEVYSAFDAGM
jgi:GMP reductase